MSAGEISGDMHGANLMEAMREREPGVRFVGLGRERMAAAGLESLEDMEAHSVLWYDALGRIPRLFDVLGRCKARWAAEKPDAVVLIDYVGFNLFLAKAAWRAGIPVFYYVAPQLWAHGAYRAAKLRRWVRRVLVIYPFEEDFYRARGVPVSYVGHPLWDELARRPVRRDVVERLRTRHGDRLVALLPGSRGPEVRRHAGLVARAAEMIASRVEGAQFVTCEAAGGEVRERLAWEANVPVHGTAATVPELARAARVALVKSGTTTLEAAAAGCPMAVFYRVGWFGHFIARGLRDCPYISLVNALAGRELVPERLMWREDGDWLAARALELLEGDAGQAMSEALEVLMAPYAKPGASAEAARVILAHL
jgi:lipid-A-disaccharide synthase